MKIRVMFLVLVLMVCTGSGVFGQSSSRDLSLTIILEKDVYAPGEHILCTLVLVNMSPKSLTVNKRLLLNYNATFPHEVLFTIIAPDGTSLELIPIIKAGPLQPEDFTVLASSRFVLKTIELERYFSFAQEGKYSIQAVYENYHQPEGMPVWVGSIKSNLVEIEITR